MKKYYTYLPDDLMDPYRKGCKFEIGKKSRNEGWWYTVFTHPIIAQIDCTQPAKRLFEVYIDEAVVVNDFKMNARCITLLQEVKVFEFTPKQYAIMALHIAKIYYDQKCNQPDDVGSRDVWKFWMDAYSSDFNQLVKVAYSIRECYYTYKSEFSSRLLFRTAQLVYMSTQENQPRKIIMTMIFDRLQDCMDYIKTPLTSDALITTIEGVIRDFDNGIV